jgi:hypothetical protein
LLPNCPTLLTADCTAIAVQTKNVAISNGGAFKRNKKLYPFFLPEILWDECRRDYGNSEKQRERMTQNESQSIDAHRKKNLVTRWF